ncbi:RsmD family RNA methyltransferase [Nocardia sp. 004]|uniref:RsmD family RNA methyltransferase n=1 Tax=Nocardia sp. 004 TaxID=3385978 RepID=UPI0039A0323E
MAQARLISGTVVLDGFAGIGGSAIAFARSGKRVIAVDTNADRLEMARHNAGVYGVRDSITFVHDDFFAVAQRTEADAVNLDPPWGGPTYTAIGRFLLSDFHPDGHALLQFSLPRFRQVVLRVPRTFDISELDRFGRSYEIHEDVTGGRTVSRTVVFRANTSRRTRGVDSGGAATHCSE